MGLSKTANVFAVNDKRELEFRSCSAHESFIGIAAVTTELVVEVSNGKFPAFLRRKVAKNVKQNHGIDTTGHGDQEALTTAKETPGGERLLNEFGYRHGETLTNNQAA
jgi:hypothetical protein